MKPEQKFKQKLKAHFEKHGAIVQFIESPTSPGFPDMVVFWPRWRTELIETKVINSENYKIKFEKAQIVFYKRLAEIFATGSTFVYVFVAKEKKVYSLHVHDLFTDMNNDLYKKKFFEIKHKTIEEKIN